MKRGVRISLVLVLALGVLLPSQVLADQPTPFEANGTVSSITPGTVKPVGSSGRFAVIEREIDGTMAGTGSISGLFTFIYKANVELATQAGNLHGTLQAGGYTFDLNGKIEPLTLVDVGPYQLPKLDISGHWSILDGAHGEGDFTAFVVFIPTPEGHVGQIVDSAFSLTGQWQH